MCDLKDKLKKYIKVEVVGQLTITHHIIDGKTVARIDVPISPRFKMMKISILGILILKTY
jgi:hypothetical protein